MKNLKAKEILTFISSGSNYEKAIQFYTEIGFSLDWKDERMAILRRDQCRFFLQNHQSDWMKDNFMMFLEVENLDDWWETLKELNLTERYEGVRLRAPENYPWGKREIHLIDPCGVLWHIATNIK